MEFLENWRPNGPWILTVISPDSGKILTKTFTDMADLERWVARQKNNNVYFTVNDLKGKFNSKPSRSDVVAMRGLHVDVDPSEDRDRETILEELQAFEPAPTCIIDSGGGYQAFWLLDEPVPVENATDLEAYNRWVEKELRGDHCHNIDRIMRLPGTFNNPDEKKRAKGRKRAPTCVVDADWARTYTLDDFGRVEMAESDAMEISRVGPVDIDKMSLSDELRAVIVNPMGEAGRYTSRSEAVFYFCCQALREDIEPDVIQSILLDPQYEISESVLEKKKAETYARRQIERACEQIDQAFLTDKNGTPHKTPHNIRVALAKLGHAASYNEFADVLLLDGELVTDNRMVQLRMEIDRRFKFLPGKDMFYDVFIDLALDNSFHPVRDWLATLKWDGTERLDTWAITHLGAEDTEYHRQMGAKMLIAAVRRIYNPGCKFDQMPVLEGAQGTYKSTAVKMLAGGDDWFTDAVQMNTDSKVIIEQSRGKWMIECAELAGMKKAAVESVKANLSRTHDRARLAYGHIAEEFARQFIVIGTTNNERYLRDDTGNRRFWPMRVGDIDLDAITRDRDQLFAEAVERHQAGEKIFMDGDVLEEAAAMQKSREEDDPWADVIGKVSDLMGDTAVKIRREHLFACLRVPTERWTSDKGLRLKKLMEDAGFEYRKAAVPGSRKKTPMFCRTSAGREMKLAVFKQRSRDKDAEWYFSTVAGAVALDGSGNQEPDENHEIPF